jgi:Zn-dependent M28 family amino/carboxypeptidase
VPETEQLTALLSAHVHILAGQIGERNIWRPRALDAAANYIRDQWTRKGHTVAEQAYLVDGVSCANLEVVLGNDNGSPALVIGAHYDTVPGSPGADDNASGVAALLELGDLLRDVELGRELRLVAFVNEEEPFFATASQGSAVYARRARRAVMDIELMISLEMLGYFSAQAGSQIYPPLFRFFYPDCGNFIAMVSDIRSRLNLSDHRSFWQQGYPAIMVTDTAFYRNPYYHTPMDTPEQVCYPELARVTRGLAGAIVAYD